MITITVKYGNGSKELKVGLSEAKEIYDALKELFEEKEQPQTIPIDHPYYPYYKDPFTPYILNCKDEANSKNLPDSCYHDGQLTDSYNEEGYSFK